jgi:hypothetical protein
LVDGTASGPPLSERLRDIGLIQQALARAVRDALQRHKQAGNKVAVWRNGRTVWVEADDLPAPKEGWDGPTEDTHRNRADRGQWQSPIRNASGKALELLKDGLQPFVEREMKSQHAQQWFAEMKASAGDTQDTLFGTEVAPRWDAAVLPGMAKPRRSKYRVALRSPRSHRKQFRSGFTVRSSVVVGPGSRCARPGWHPVWTDQLELNLP